jgi:hypothetical protein
MTRLVLHLLALAQLASCAVTWGRAARVTQAVAIAGLACDGLETREVLADSKWVETNPVLGQHPSPAALWTYLAAVGVAMLGVDKLAGHKVGVVAAVAVAGIEIWSMQVNASVGSSVCGLGAGGPWKTLPDGESGAIAR